MKTNAEIKQLARESAAGPLDGDQAIPTALMFLIAMLGGFIAFYRKYKDGVSRAFNFTELIGEMFVSGICGVLAWWAFTGLGVNQWLTAAGVGVVGHMGSRALFMAEKLAENQVTKWIGGERRAEEQRRDDDKP